MGFLGSSYTHVSEFLLSGVTFEPLLLAFAPLAVLANHPPAPILCLRHSGPTPRLGQQVGLPPLPFAMHPLCLECFPTSSPLLPRVTPSGVLGLRRRRGASVSALLGSLPLPPGLCWGHQEHPPLCVSVSPPALSSERSYPAAVPEEKETN